MTGLACLSAAAAVSGFVLKLPQAFPDGQNSLSVFAAGLTAPDGAGIFFSQDSPGSGAVSSRPAETAEETPSGAPEESATSSQSSAQAAAAGTASGQASGAESAAESQTEKSGETGENPGEEVPYTGGPPEEGEAVYPINEVQIGPSGTQYENFSVKSTCQTQIDIGAELEKKAGCKYPEKRRARGTDYAHPHLRGVSGY